MNISKHFLLNVITVKLQSILFVFFSKFILIIDLNLWMYKFDSLLRIVQSKAERNTSKPFKQVQLGYLHFYQTWIEIQLWVVYFSLPFWHASAKASHAVRLMIRQRANRFSLFLLHLMSFQLCLFSIAFMLLASVFFRCLYKSVV